MKRLILSLILFVFFISMLSAGDIDRDMLFKSGVSAYVAEEYHKALSIFHQLESEDMVSWELFYNLGNAYYRNNDLGNAIRYWEKAKILSPNNSDIKYNLSIAEQHLIDKVVLPDMFPVFKWYADLKKNVSIDTLVMMIGLVLFLILGITGFVRIMSRQYQKDYKKTGITIVSILLAILLLLAVVSIDSSITRKNNKYAIILDDTVNIYSEPDEDALVLFILHEGSKVKVNKKIEDSWSNISYFDDKIGWIKAKSLGEIEK